MAPILADDGGRMKVVHRKDAKALKGDKSLSYQVINPDNVGSRKFLVTVVDIRPGGSTPVHEHRTVESMYYILEGRGEVTSGRERKVLGPDTAVYFPAGSTHGIRNVGKARLRYLSCHAPPYEIEDLYRSWQAHESLVTTGG
ncbi:MAG TPA: cupin domain-containing protein [Thermoplasmata archaeon]|nr:cupin domain-containing protein [Thermoplasmata archaeon]